MPTVTFRSFLDSPTRPLWLVATIPLSLLATACTHLEPAPPPAEVVALPDTWSAPLAVPTDIAATATDLSSWWTKFNDPVLARLIDDALLHSPDIRSAISRVAESRARRLVQRADLLPSLSAGVSGQGSATRNHETNTTATGESYSADLNASWQVDLFGEQGKAVDAATADLKQTTANLHVAQISLVAEVATTYVNLRAYERRLDVTERSLATREESTQLTTWREQAGVGDVLESRQASASLEQTRATLPTLRQSISETRHRLALLCGQTPAALDTLLHASAPVPTPPADLALTFPAETLRQRPDVQAAGFAVEAANARTSSARRQRLPSLSLNGSLGVDALKAGDLFSPTTTLANVVGSLTAPIFDAGRIRQSIRIQDELTEQALAAYESTVLTALSEVENALVAIQRTGEREASLTRAVGLAREAQELAQQRYDAGQVDFLTVLDAQRTLLSLEDSLVTTAADQTNAHIQLYLALGGGWSAPPTSGTAD